MRADGLQKSSLKNALLQLGSCNAKVGVRSVEVYFDDMKVTQVKSPVIAEQSYYPFGLTFSDFARENSIRNKYLYNAGAERQEDLGLNWDYTFYRTYDPSSGRFLQVDPKVDDYYSWTPYNYAYDNPALHNDPRGDCTTCNEFLNGVKEGFANNIKSIGKVLTTNPVTTIKGITGKGVAEFAANAATLGGYGIVKQNYDLGKAIINGDAKTAGNIIGDAGANVTTAVVLGAAGKAVSSVKKSVPSGLGDLTKGEIKSIQKVVNTAERPLEVGGSAASGTRRGVGTNLPIGKGAGTRSDIDYIAPPSSHPYFDGLQNQLPGLDPSSGIIPGTGNPYIGPTIRFEPGSKPTVIPAATSTTTTN